MKFCIYVACDMVSFRWPLAIMYERIIIVNVISSLRSKKDKSKERKSQMTFYLFTVGADRAAKASYDELSHQTTFVAISNSWRTRGNCKTLTRKRFSWIHNMNISISLKWCRKQWLWNEVDDKPFSTWNWVIILFNSVRCIVVERWPANKWRCVGKR